MLTPATSASSTSAPAVIIENAFSTHVIVPPFLYRCPLAEEMTVGLTLFFVIAVGAWPKAGVAAAASPAVLVTTKSRREILSGMGRGSYSSAFVRWRRDCRLRFSLASHLHRYHS